MKVRPAFTLLELLLATVLMLLLMVGVLAVIARLGKASITPGKIDTPARSASNNDIPELDNASLVAQRKITVPFVKDVLGL